MKRRIVTSIIAAGVYTIIYAGILVYRNQELKESELVVGALVFAVIFYVMRTWLDKRRYRQNIDTELKNK
jgi:multisubunit Na+/H+ antiporter MnhE subunit